MGQIELGELTPQVIDYLEQEVLPLCHSKEFVAEVKERCAKLAENETEGDQKHDMYYASGSYHASLLSLLAAVKGVKAIMNQEY